MDKPLISLILPVYNAAPFLPACLRSIAAQTWPNWELIAIDDGSRDSSREILDDFAGKHPHVTLIFQDNAGVSRARNRGLEAARGQYLAFCDGDDLLAPDYLETLVQALESTGADWSACGFSRFSGDEVPGFTAGSSPVSLTGAEQYAALVRDPHCGGYLWNKLFRRDLAEAAPALRMREDLNILEDLVFCLAYAQRCTALARTSAALYGYRIHSASALGGAYNARRLTAVTGREAALNLVPEGEIRAHAWNDLMLEYAISHKKLLGSTIPEGDTWKRRIHCGFRRHRGQYPLDSRWGIKEKLYYLLLAAWTISTAGISAKNRERN